MKLRHRLLLTAVALPVLFALAGPAYDRCNRPSEAAISARRGIEVHGDLSVGAGEARIAVPFPITVAGYGPLRPEATSAVAPLHARAVVVERRKMRYGLVNADALLIPDALADALRQRAWKLGLVDVLVIATHSHSSLGGYDPHLVPEVAALGRYRPEARDALLNAMTEALRQAIAQVQPAELTISSAEVPSLLQSRDPGEPVDSRLTRVGFFGEKGAIAQWILFAAHPTTAGRTPGGVDPDYPGRLAAEEEARGHGVTLFLPGAVGNARASDANPERFAQKVAEALGHLGPVSPASNAVAPGSAQTVSADAQTAPEMAPARAYAADVLRLDQAYVPLPHPDARRLVPFGFRHVTEDLLCASAPFSMRLAFLDLGALQLVMMPGEPTAQAARAMERAVGPRARVVSLADGYVGYVETPDAVRAGSGEAKRQYFGPELLGRFEQALNQMSNAPPHTVDGE